jgi:hypothetical protein
VDDILLRLEGGKPLRASEHDGSVGCERNQAADKHNRA